MTIYKISLSDAQADKLADWLSSTTGEVDSRIAEEIRAQIPKPAIEEPEGFGSIVRAVCLGGSEQQLWQRSYGDGKHYWESEHGIVEVWSDLTHVEVLRVGIGEPPPMTEEEIDESQATAQRNLSHGLQVGVLRCIGGTVDHPAHAMYCPAHGALRGKP